MSHEVVTPGASIGERAAHAVANPELQQAMRNLDVRLPTARIVADHLSPLKDRAAALRRETLADLPGWLDRVEATLTGLGVHVHRAATPADARRIILAIAQEEKVTRAVKSKSMATEEIDLVDALEDAGIEAVETDLGEYIVQVAGERPSHMIVPAIHKTLGQVAEVLETRANGPLPVEAEAITAWARDHLRARFLAADLGITGANFVAADTGTIVLVTNEGNGDLCTIIPRVQVAVVPVEKVIARFSDLATLLPLLTMSATGQRISNYVTMINGPRRDGELDGPEVLHVVLLDHGRTRLVGTPYEDMLACIRCGACLNVCPVFRRISGHAYDAVYSGPMGKVLTPLLSLDGSDGRDLPGASTLCGACTEACPVEIPLADLLVRLRADLRRPGLVEPLASQPAPTSGPPVGLRQPGEGFHSRVIASALAARAAPPSRRRQVFNAWALLWARPGGYRASTSAARIGTRVLGRRWTRRQLPGMRGWVETRDSPLPAPRSFRRQWGRASTRPRGQAMVTGAATTSTFLGAAARSGIVVHGPLSADEATQRAVACAVAATDGRPVAVPATDPLVEELDLRAALAWAGATLLVATDVDWRNLIGFAGAGVTGALRAIAATGTLVLPCGPGRPRGTHIVPPAHVCLVRANDIVGTIEEAVQEQAAAPHPSNVSWVSGPSRTADLEMQLTIGVHGPKRVDVIVVA